MYEFATEETHSSGKGKASFLKATHRSAPKESKKKAKSPSIVMALARSFGGTFFLAGLFKLCQDLLNFVSPQLLKYVFLIIEQ